MRFPDIAPEIIHIYPRLESVSPTLSSSPFSPFKIFTRMFQTLSFFINTPQPIISHLHSMKLFGCFGVVVHIRMGFLDVETV